MKFENKVLDPLLFELRTNIHMKLRNIWIFEKIFILQEQYIHIDSMEMRNCDLQLVSKWNEINWRWIVRWKKLRYIERQLGIWITLRLKFLNKGTKCLCCIPKPSSALDFHRRINTLSNLKYSTLAEHFICNTN